MSTKDTSTKVRLRKNTISREQVYALRAAIVDHPRIYTTFSIGEVEQWLKSAGLEIS